MTRQLTILLSVCTALALGWVTPAFGQSVGGEAIPSAPSIGERSTTLPEKSTSPLSGAEMGACCFEDGSCSSPITVAACNVQGGFFQGINTDCVDVACEGACCLGNGSCSVGTVADCDAAGGVWEGYGTDCSCVTCDVGACCLPTADPDISTCTESTRALCEVLGGLYMGGGTDCGGLTFCEAQVDGFKIQIAPNEATLVFDQFDPQDNGDGPTRILEKVILFMENRVGLWAQVENGSEIPIPNGVLSITVDETLDFRSDMSLGFGFNELLPAPVLAPVDLNPNQGPDFHNYGHVNLCAFDIDERVAPGDDLAAYIGLGTLNAEFGATGLVGFLASTDFEFFFDDFFAWGEVKVAYLYRVLEGACCLCDGTCEDQITLEACNELAMNQTGQLPLSFTPDATCDEVSCEAIGACCLCTGECLENVTESECEANPNFRAFFACTTCADVIDCEPVGACCLCTGECLENVTEAACLANSDSIEFFACMSCSEIDCEPIGACCLCTGECIENITQADCFANPDFQSFSQCKTCAEIDCEPIGACCLCTGNCIDSITQSSCEANPNFVSFHPCQDCADLDCEEVGACCLCTGECLENVTRTACESNPDFVSFQACASCADIACEPVGVCCLCTGECLDNVTQADCEANPDFQSYAACLSCDDINCEPIGACCLCTGECLENVTEADCLANPDFVRFEACVSCADLEIPCEASGACCFCDGDVCEVVSADECASRGPDWRYLGDCTDCTDCVAVGACCLPGQVPDCVENVTAEECAAAGGENFTPCASCSEIICIKGACCLADESCVDDVYEQECYDLGGFSFHPNAVCEDVICEVECRIRCTDKGSLIIFSKIEVRWDESGNLLQDTFIQISNDHPDSVNVQFYFINGDAPIAGHPGWNMVDNQIELTGNQPMNWSAVTGSGLVSPWTVLDPGPPPGRPADDGTGDYYLRGYIIGWAVNDLGEEIRWNHLSGSGTLVYYGGDHAAWEYNACTSRVLDSVAAHGEVTGTPGVLKLDGSEYCSAPSQLLMNFQAVGSNGYATIGVDLVSDTDVTLHPLNAVLDPDAGASPVVTKAHYDVWNENETKLSGAYRCISCWDQTLLSQYGVPNHFTLAHLQTDQGKARIDGLESPLCAGSENAALLGLVARWLSFPNGNSDGMLAASGVNMIGMGFETAVITIPIYGGEPPEAPGGGVAIPTSPFEAADTFIEGLRKSMIKRSDTSTR